MSNKMRLIEKLNKEEILLNGKQGNSKYDYVNLFAELKNDTVKVKYNFKLELSVENQFGRPGQMQQIKERILKLAEEHKVKGVIINDSYYVVEVEWLKKAIRKVKDTGHEIDLNENKYYHKHLEDKLIEQMEKSGYNVIGVVILYRSDGYLDMKVGYSGVDKYMREIDRDPHTYLTEKDKIYYIRSYASSRHAPIEYFYVNGIQYHNTDEVMSHLYDTLV